MKERILSDALQTAVLQGRVAEGRSSRPNQHLPAAVHVQHGVNRLGKHIHYYFNYSAAKSKQTTATAQEQICSMERLLRNQTQLTLAPWDLAIVEEN